MARAPGLSALAGAAVDRRGETRLWWATLAVGFALCVAYAVTPAEHVVVRDFVLYPLTDLLAAVSVVVGVRLYRPQVPAAWLLIAAYLLLSMAGDLTWGAYEVAGKSPTASLADVFYLAAYPCVLGGLLIAIRRRSPSRDWREVIDSLIVGTSAFLLLWVYIVNPYTLGGLGWKDALVAIAYPVADTVVLAAVVRLMLAGDWSVPALRLLFLGLSLTLAGDIAYADGTISHFRVVDMLLQFGIVAIGLAGLHRSMPALTTKSESKQTSTGGGIVRLAVLVGVCAVPLLVLAIQAISNYGLHLVAVIVTLAVLAMLVVARSIGLAITAEQAAEREASLSRYAAELLRTVGRDELFAAADRTAGELVKGGRASIVERDGSDQPPVAHPFTTPVEIRGDVIADLVADDKESALRRVAGSLTTVAAQLSLALERERLLATERQTAEALTRRNEELDELDRMKDLFVRGVSHELRTPLTSLIGYVELLRRGDVGELSLDQQRFLEIVERNCHRLNNLVEDILFVSRVYTGRLLLDRAPVDVGELVADRVESIRPAAERDGIEVRLRLEGSTSRLQGDRPRLAQLLDNLLSNAVKFTAEGGGVDVIVSAFDDHAHVQVDDTGVGIPGDEVERIFERFFRASTARDAPGTGLGLAIAKSIVEAHGGTISARSRVGVGTTVAVDLPLQAEAAASADDPPKEVIA